ncbi:MAG: NINE protein [Lachnospiraceae bacterium]
MAKGKYKNKKKSAENEGSSWASKANSVPVFDRKEYDANEEKFGFGNAADLTDLDFELQAAQREAGMEENTYGVWGPIWKFMKWYDSFKKPHTFKKKNYMWLMLFTGWMGGHRWYQGRRILGAVETALCWTGIPLILLVTDFMEVFPIKPDENGMITMK